MRLALCSMAAGSRSCRANSSDSAAAGRVAETPQSARSANPPARQPGHRQMTSQDLRQDHTEDLELHLHPHRKIREYPSFEARERERTEPLPLYRASKREREGPGASATGG